MDVDTEEYILLLLSDGNLPTGSFVASSGLESYAKHGFLSSVMSHGGGSVEKVVDFIRYSLESYSHSALPFVMDAHIAVSRALASCKASGASNLENFREGIIQLDALYDGMTLNHVTRRASKAQGVALLTLFSKGFSRPAWLVSEDSDNIEHWSAITSFIDQLKLEIRRNTTHGHLPVCWGVLTAALGLSGGWYHAEKRLYVTFNTFSERSQFLHLFLHARGLLSAAIRMNAIGPYAAQQLLLHVIRPLVEAQITQCRHIRTGEIVMGSSTTELHVQNNIAVTVDGPANTWPLGEILAARHDLQHSRIFNS